MKIQFRLQLFIYQQETNKIRGFNSYNSTPVNNEDYKCLYKNP